VVEGIPLAGFFTLGRVSDSVPNRVNFARISRSLRLSFLFFLIAKIAIFERFQ
jgi:hypothetical protein